MKKSVFALALALSLLIPQSAALADTFEPSAERCAAMTTAINSWRQPADLSVYTLMCNAAANRAIYVTNLVNSCMSYGHDVQYCADRYWVHNLAYPTQVLRDNNVCYRNVGEVMAWSSIIRNSVFWSEAWRNSPSHYEVLNNSAFNKGGGHYTAGTSGFNDAVYYVVDPC